MQDTRKEAPYLVTSDEMTDALNAALDEGGLNRVMGIMGDLARAHRMRRVAQETGLGEKSLYKSMRAGASPEFNTVLRVLRALGFRLKVIPIDEQGDYAKLEIMAMETTAAMVKNAVEKAYGTYQEWFRSDQPSLGETQTRYALIAPILRALGWDTADPKVCYPEWRIKNQRVDYALFPRSDVQDLVDGLAVPAILIEAKSLYRPDQPRGESGQAIWEDDIQQLQDYIDAEPRMDVGLAVFTNGRKWLLYILGDTHRLRDINPVAADLERDDPGFFAQKLEEHMGRQHW